MEPFDCGAGRHLPQLDDDGDTVCQVCRRVLNVGPLGINGWVYGERIGFVSGLACVSQEPYETDEPPAFETCAFTFDALKVMALVAQDMRRGQKRKRIGHAWRNHTRRWLRQQERVVA